uniref:DUF1722 domain-containing protein n=1 Tax=candidate division WOR-3 bacterium TaxID=2052148 RepID=A0A7C4U7A7_UNCW3
MRFNYHLKPKIVISKCFFKPVRYDGGIVIDDFINRLKNYVDFIEVCPEIGIGLSVPRKKIIILFEGEKKKLFQPETGIDLTYKMRDFSERFLNELNEIDGFILKSKSPSCGVSSAKCFKDNNICGKTDGFFAEEAKKRFPHLPVEDEGRLRDDGIREHFLTRIFAFSEFRELKENLSQDELVKFHSIYKFLLLSYNQKNLRELGRIVAEKKNIKDKMKDYEKIFFSSFDRRPSKRNIYNAIIHIFGFFSDNMNIREKKHFLNIAEKFKEGNLEKETIVEMLKNLANRFNNEYILNQKFLNPYPDELNYKNF